VKSIDVVVTRESNRPLPVGLLENGKASRALSSVVHRELRRLDFASSSKEGRVS
jgi:hypothetical protein